MKYKAKKSYREIEKNFSHFKSPIKHKRLLNGEWVEITSPPDELKEHLTQWGKKVPKEKKDGN